MSLESAIADLVSASTKLTQSVNVTRATVEATRDTVIAQEAPVTDAKDATAASATAATTDTATTASKLTAAAADYAAQKTTKGLAAVQTSADSELKDRLHRRDPARHPFRGARPSLVMDFVRRECHRNNAAGNLEPVDLSTFMTFTRGSTATYVGPDGLIKEAAVNTPRYGYDPVTGEALGLLVEEQRTNLLSYSAYPAAASTGQGWNRINCDVYPNVAVAPDGTMTAAKAVVSVGEATTGNDGVGVFATPSVTSSATHTLTLYVKDAGAGYLRIRESINTGQIAKINLTTGAITAEAGYTTATFTVTATNVGNGWWRVVVVRTPTTTFGFNLKPGIDVGDGVSGIYVWGAQLEAGSFPTSYIPTPATFTGRASTKTYFDSNGMLQTAASGVAVTDYGYVDGRWVSKGLSLEPQATNLVLQSQNFSGWWVTAASISGAKTTAPDGTVSGTPLTPDAAATLNSYTTMLYFGAYDGTQKTFSAFVKSNGLDRVRLRMVDNSTSASTSIFVDLTDGSIFTAPVSNASWTGVNGSVTPVSNGWYRITVTGTGVGGGTVTAGILPYDSVLTTGDGVKGLYIWGAQLETGPVATSYIPTTTAQVTRAADTSTSAQVTRAKDDASVTGTNFTAGWYSAEGWSLGVQFQSPITTTAPDRGVFGFGSGVGLRGVGLRLRSHINDFSVFNVRDSSTNLNETTQDSANVAGVKYTAGCSAAFDGSARYTLNNSALSKQDIGFVRPIVTSLYIGQQNAAWGLVYIGGYIRQLTYFPRQLSDADLQALTILED